MLQVWDNFSAAWRARARAAHSAASLQQYVARTMASLSSSQKTFERAAGLRKVELEEGKMQEFKDLPPCALSSPDPSREPHAIRATRILS